MNPNPHLKTTNIFASLDTDTRSVASNTEIFHTINFLAQHFSSDSSKTVTCEGSTAFQEVLDQNESASRIEVYLVGEYVRVDRSQHPNVKGVYTVNTRTIESACLQFWRLLHPELEVPKFIRSLECSKVQALLVEKLEGLSQSEVCEVLEPLVDLPSVGEVKEALGL